jgi:DNA-binding HxlR family transcriptional regulator
MNAILRTIPHRSPARYDLDSLQKALEESTLNAGLKVLGDRWSMAILRTAFVGVRRFDDWLQQLGLPKPTLAARLKSMVALGIFYKRVYQERPLRESYHLSARGLALYDTVLMSWAWESRWGGGVMPLPHELVHGDCGHPFTPELSCSQCHQQTTLEQLRLGLRLHECTPANSIGQTPAAGLSATARGTRISGVNSRAMTLGLRVDRWALMVVAAVMLGNHHFDQLAYVLRIAPSVLARRLRDLVTTGLLRCDPDPDDARRQFYRLTPASRALSGYLVCFSHWSSEHLCHRASTIAPQHSPSGHDFFPEVVCSHCLGRLKPWAVRFSYGDST